MSKKSFVLYKDFKPQIDKLTRDQKGELLECIYSYQCLGEYKADDLVVDFAMGGLISQFERDEHKYLAICDRNKRNGQKSQGRPKNPVVPSGLSGNPVAPKKPDSDSGSENDSVSATYTKEFEEFWNIYPKKKEKIRSQKSFTKAKKVATVEEIMAGLRVAVRSEDWIKNGGQYVPKPANWLDGGGWDDEVATQKQTTGSTKGVNGQAITEYS